MNEFRAKMNVNGRVLIPAECRNALHLKQNEELVITIVDDELRIYSLRHALKKAQELVQSYAKNQSLVKKLKEMRQEDSGNE